MKMEYAQAKAQAIRKAIADKDARRIRRAKAVREIWAARKADATWEFNSMLRRIKIYAQAQQTETAEDAQKSSVARNAIAAGVGARLRLRKAAAHMRKVRAAQKALISV
jgi:hypothetical protein